MSKRFLLHSNDFGIYFSFVDEKVEQIVYDHESRRYGLISVISALASLRKATSLIL